MSDEIIQVGKFITLTYVIHDCAGNTLEYNDLPVSYIQGSEHTLIGGMEQAVVGKRPGDEVEVEIPPERGFGQHDPDLTFTDDLDNVPEQFRYVGAEVPMENEAGEVKTFYVTRIEHNRLTVDGNHPFAGKTLRVRVKIIAVRDPTEADWRSISDTVYYH